MNYSERLKSGRRITPASGWPVSYNFGELVTNALSSHCGYRYWTSAEYMCAAGEIDVGCTHENCPCKVDEEGE